MKQYINLLVIIIVGIAAYTVYGLVTFQVDDSPPFVFAEPKLPPEIIAENSALSEGAEGQREKAAITAAKMAIAKYRAAQDAAPQQAKDTMSILTESAANSELPPYFLSSLDVVKGGSRSFQTLEIDGKNFLDVEPGKKSLTCSSKAPFANILIGTSAADTLTCDKVRDIYGEKNEGDILFIGGPDNDVITDTTGNRIVNGGTGDDKITLGAGRSIIVLHASWGQDTLTVDCAGATVTGVDTPKDFSIPWTYKTTNFIVLGSGLEPKDMTWSGNILTNPKTGDTLTVNENCFTVVPAIQ